MKIKLKKLYPDVQMPQYETEGAAGFDLRAHISEKKTLKPGERFAVPTGISIELPMGFELQIRARSGLAARNGITLMNGIGTIDCDYRGEVHALIVNHGNEDFVIEPNMRIAQGVIARYEHVEFEEVEELSETKRGGGGFGSTGV